MRKERGSDMRSEGAARRERRSVVGLGDVQAMWGLVVRGSGRMVGLAGRGGSSEAGEEFACCSG